MGITRQWGKGKFSSLRAVGLLTLRILFLAVSGQSIDEITKLKDRTAVQI